jgi:organic hydroperoxide reductase OsmC/OhrA
VEFAIPETFGGQGKAFCPDELFAASVVGCLMNTFLHTRERLGLDMEAFSLQAQMEIEFKHGRYHITKVAVEGTLIIDENDTELGEECLRIAKDYCHISRALEPFIPIEYQITIESSVE